MAYILVILVAIIFLLDEFQIYELKRTIKTKDEAYNIMRKSYYSLQNKSKKL